jgi:ferredoxin
LNSEEFVVQASLIAMGIAIFLVVNLVIGLAILSLLTGTFESLFGKPKLTILRATKSGNIFAFGFKWNSAKEPASIDTIRIRLFNPFGNPTQVEVSKPIEPRRSSFATEVDLGPGFIELLGAQGLDTAVMQVEVASAKNGVSFQFDMRGPKFRQMISEAKLTADQFISQNKLDVVRDSKPPIDIPIRSFIADVVPGRGPQLKMATNPAFAGDFSAAPTSTGGAGGAGAENAVPNFVVAKVWIEPGCIVCNACEDIYKDVFEVLADTCIIRPNAPLDDGLRIQEAAEACPVEVIKFTKAG